MVIAGLFFALIGSITLVAAAMRLVRHALPPAERAAFQQAGNRSGWTATTIAAMPGSVGSFAQQVLDGAAEVDRVDLICERLASVDLDTAHVERSANMFARCALAIAATAFVGVITWGLQLPTRALLLVGGGITCAIALASALFCWRLGQHTKAAVRERRRDWDRLAQVLLHFANSTGDPRCEQARLHHEQLGTLLDTSAPRKGRGKSDAYNPNLTVE